MQSDFVHTGKESFDHAASDYDREFTQSGPGYYQRQQVHSFLRKYKLSGLKVLELNGGTGEDALYMSDLGARVKFTDSSKAMLKVAGQKLKGKNVAVELIKMPELSSESGNEYDLIFSNFGGLNCLEQRDVAMFMKSAGEILGDEGRLCLVLMGRFCLWESLYFFLKGRWNQVWRRKTDGPLMANVKGRQVPTWYYSPSRIRAVAGSKWKMRSLLPVGFFIPPSYLGTHFGRNNIILRFLAACDSLVRFSFFAGASDHYLIEFEKRNQD